MAVLPLVPPEAIGDAFLIIHEDAPLNEKSEKFHDYVVETYLDDDSPFPV